jgi:hypothetical protein
MVGTAHEGFQIGERFHRRIFNHSLKIMQAIYG